MVSVGSGFSVGLAGPAAEIGMALAQQISSAVYGASSYKNKDQDITDDEQLRCMAHCIVAGAAAGITANFNAPVTGLLYALEVTRTLFPMKTIENASQPLKDPVLHWLPLSISIIGALMVLRKPFLLDLAHPLPVQWLMMKSVPIVLENSSTTSRTLLLKLSLWLWFIGLAGMYGVAYRWFNQLKEVLLQQIQYQLSQISASSSSQITELKQIKPWQTFWQQWIWAGGVTACVCWVALQSGFNPQLSYNMNLVPMWLQMNNPKVLSLKFLSLFLISRVAVTSLSAASTSVGALVGGQFAPMFVFGAGLGGLLHRLSLKFVQLSSSTWNRPLLDMFAATELFPVFVLIGGSAWIACQTQSPLLSTVFVWEMTQSHWSMVPLIFMTNAVALWSSQRPTGKKNA
jgi:H+/Cl- antiporter ClcA